MECSIIHVHTHDASSHYKRVEFEKVKEATTSSARKNSSSSPIIQISQCFRFIEGTTRYTSKNPIERDDGCLLYVCNIKYVKCMGHFYNILNWLF